MSQITNAIQEALEATVQELGYELVEVRYAKEHGQNTLTVFLDAKNGIGFDDCERVSAAAEPILDTMDFTNGAPYNFNVSSAGLDRPIKTDKDYLRNMGRLVEAKLYAPLEGTKTKIINGTLSSKNGDTVTVTRDNGMAVELKISQIANLTQWIKFDQSL